MDLHSATDLQAEKTKSYVCEMINEFYNASL